MIVLEKQKKNWIDITLGMCTLGTLTFHLLACSNRNYWTKNDINLSKSMTKRLEQLNKD